MNWMKNEQQKFEQTSIFNRNFDRIKKLDDQKKQEFRIIKKKSSFASIKWLF